MAIVAVVGLAFASFSGALSPFGISLVVIAAALQLAAAACAFTRVNAVFAFVVLWLLIVISLSSLLGQTGLVFSPESATVMVVILVLSAIPLVCFLLPSSVEWLPAVKAPFIVLFFVFGPILGSAIMLTQNKRGGDENITYSNALKRPLL